MVQQAAAETEVAIGFHTAKDIGSPEISVPVQGTIPSWVKGVLYRTGPGIYEGGSIKVRHWFDGYGCVYRFEIGDGEVKYRSELINETVYAQKKRGNEIWFGQDVCKGVFGKVMGMWSRGKQGMYDTNVSVTVGKFPGKDIVVRTDSAICVEIDPVTAKEKDRFTYETINVGEKGSLDGEMAAAHAQFDVQKGELWNFSLKMGPPPGGEYSVLRVIKEGAKKMTEIKRAPSYIHSFAMTENYVILMFWPCIMGPLKMLYEKNLLDSLHWKNEKTKFFVIDRSSGRHVATYESDPFFCFHTVNAYELPHQEDGRTRTDIVIDLCRYDDMKIIESFKNEYLRTKKLSFFPKPMLTRYTLHDMELGKTRGPDLFLQATEHRVCSTHSIELPRYNSAFHMRPYKYAYGVMSNEDYGQFIFNGLVKIDVQTGEATVWSEPHCHPGEPIFLKGPSASEEDEDGGVLLSVVLDSTAQCSFLLVLNAKNMEEIARANVNRVMPFGFHGNFIAAK